MIQIQLKREGKTAKTPPIPVLELSLPEQSRAPKDTVLNDVKKCARWLARLPRANMGEVSRRIFNAIIDFNRIEMPAKTRLRVAELFPAEVSYIVTNLEKYYIDSALPLSRKNRKVAILCRELYLELTLSYKLIVSQLVNRRRRFDQNLLIVALHRAVYYLGMVHRQSALHYEAPPPGCWSELHRLYAYAWQNQIDQVPVRIKQDGKVVESTIESLYIQTCVLSVCAPNRLTNAQLQAVQHLLPEWSETIKLNHEVPLTNDNPHPLDFAVDLFSDAPPTSIKTFDALTPRHHLAFDCNKLVRHLRKQFNAIQPEQRKSNRYRLQLYRQIIDTLRNAERSFVRTELHFNLNLVKGLGAVYHLLNADDEAPAESEYSSLLTTRHPGHSSLADLDGLNFDSEELFNETMNEQEAKTNPARQAGNDPAAGASPFFTCQTANESASGYCLIWPHEKAPRVKVGDLLGIQSPTRKQHFSIAVVRWLTYHPGESLHVGIESIAPVCGAVRLTTRSINPGDAKSTIGLLSPEIASASQDNSVLLPATFPVESRILEAETEDEIFSLKLTQLIESTPAFNRYGYQRIDASGQQADSGLERSRFIDSESLDDGSDGEDSSDNWTLS